MERQTVVIADVVPTQRIYQRSVELGNRAAQGTLTGYIFMVRDHDVSVSHFAEHLDQRLLRLDIVAAHQTVILSAPEKRPVHVRAGKPAVSLIDFEDDRQVRIPALILLDHGDGLVPG